VLLRNHVAHRSGMIASFGVAEDAAAQRKVDFSLTRHLQCKRNVRFTPESGQRRAQRMLASGNSGHLQSSKNGSLFNHLVGTSEQRRWNNNAKGFGGLQVDNKLER
jgi:hypothetical protein